MTQETTSPIRNTDDTARALAQDVITASRLAALAVLDPTTGAPHVTRIAFGLAQDGTWMTLISDLSAHTQALRTDTRAGLLLGEAPGKGDPLAFPRLSARVDTDFVTRDDPRHGALRTAWLSHHPKSALYVDFADFSFVTFTPLTADLNGGFGKAYKLTAADLIPTQS
ncbi:pyridoxamine 5'-phosphate oxidase family protein [Celeribacter baekdonensis]|jgi:heme iron utilization protein|uniref:Pyridoxamine 5-phosphate oxidase n=1 Tax=Celeribacter baekdonensis TaxID=875171 RepID=A0A2R4M873_9RHOB|nr:pyridoxamine 5'-phosphate oxidase family protein [Celeribacter baekdonensis]AVW93259.1 pyridoxamine 5-phosphate oxidase [Celeribacter baekdonensis]